ncbi:MAG: sugar-binding transcriptional regulator [Bryobacteraceae bacterium]
MARLDELRLMVKVARMYYQQGLTQNEIMDRLHIHQSTVSRLLKRAEREGIVRVVINAPPGIHAELEEALQSAYGLKDAVVVETGEDEDQIVRDLGAAAAFVLENTLKPGEVIGISCWSAALLAMVDAMHPTSRAPGARVVQILGGVGSPGAPTHATIMTRRLAALIGAEITLLPAPGVVGSPQARRILMQDPFVQEAVEWFKSVTLALVGIGSVEPSKMLAASGNVFSSDELKLLSSKAAVGDICLRFFDAAGRPVITPLNDRVISMELAQLRRVPRVIGVAGGKRKTAAIRGALAGKWINVLITDRATAERLLEERSLSAARAVQVPATRQRSRRS